MMRYNKADVLRLTFKGGKIRKIYEWGAFDFK